MLEVLSIFDHWLELVVSFEFLRDVSIPKSIFIVVVVHWKICAVVFPHEMSGGGLWVSFIFEFQCSLSFQLLLFDLV